ncbi:MAG TPA: MFS transporter, partial [Myxococcota bacterium]|nr:MFS transporter [Myxococcota bacterium]
MNVNNPTPSHRSALAGLSLLMLLSSLGTSIANVALPAMARAFAAPFSQVQWVVLAYLLGVTTFIVSAGRLGDLYGRRRLLIAGLLLFGGAAALSGVAPWLWLVIGARALQGLGAAVLMALSLALVGEVVPKERTGAAMGLMGTTSAVGTALGPSLGGLLTDQWGWRAIFAAQVPLSMVALFLVLRVLPVDRARGGGQGLDPVG